MTERGDAAEVPPNQHVAHAHELRERVRVQREAEAPRGHELRRASLDHALVVGRRPQPGQRPKFPQLQARLARVVDRSLAQLLVNETKQPEHCAMPRRGHGERRRRRRAHALAQIHAHAHTRWRTYAPHVRTNNTDARRRAHTHRRHD